MSEETITTKIKRLQQPLPNNEIELRVGNIFEYGDKIGCVMLAYKTARADARRLDDVLGAMNWQKRYRQDSNNNTVCAIDVWDKSKKMWVSKEDVGDDNQQGCKGTYSDAFKRAGFSWGIGRELYELPVLFVNLTEDEVRRNGNKLQQSNKLKIQQWTFERNIKADSVEVIIRDEKSSVRFKSTDVLDERNSTKKYMNNTVEDKFYNDICLIDNKEDLDALFEEMKEDYIITETHKTFYHQQMERINSTEPFNYSDKHG